ncbi:MAG: DNA polymerase LigD [Candidatus Yanofskybacteria bacterium RIFCSPLOWO2_01_FULL_49_17]|uniref:DNA polymerase LigD n=1 Tax=Candidatus Yanofskybacteria bacterium RIFCSPLOWO2_01_FULL_49_17 TaxID=1802700 RepID=A0A1F8GSC0_9BACT|nr:MAG: DNA polymerase LigD [Candidatus Yanofskybacteria bacterium RIFCSPLOWO2_01_FULL_49_17]
MTNGYLKIDGHEVTVTNRDKVYFPGEGITKGDIIDYYWSVASLILPYLKDRPENLNRHPDGIDGESFYQKDVDHEGPDWVRTVGIHSESTGKTVRYLVCDDEAALVYIANLGCIEINPWNSRVDKLDKPDYLIVELDPQNIDFSDVIKTAQEVRKIFEELEIESYCKTSGKRGLHIFVPTGAKYAYETVRDIAELIAKEVNRRLPEITSVVRDPAKRKRLVYVDYLQNSKGQTLAAPYSARPVLGATVSTPLEWSEVRVGLDPKKFTIKNILKRVDKKGDLWQPVLGKGINLDKISSRLERL